MNLNIGEKIFFSFSNLILVGLVVLGLIFISFYNYLLFHTLAEFFGILIAFSLFGIIWNARNVLKNNYFILLGIAYFFVGSLDLFHLLSFKGMGVFASYAENLTAQLSIASRYLLSVTFLIAPLFINRRFNPKFYLLVYSLIIFVVIVLIFVLQIFPSTYTEGIGLTKFAIFSGFIISAIFFLSIYFLLLKKQFFNKHVLNTIIFSIILIITSNTLLTLYTDSNGTLDLIGHAFKMFAYYFIYLAIIDIGFNRPYNLLFFDLRQKENLLREEKDKVEKYLDLANSFFVVLDTNQRIKLINKMGAKILGYEKEKIIGKNWFEHFIPKNERKAVVKVFEKTLKGEIEPVSTFENKIVAKNGAITMEWHNSYIKNSKGKIVSVLSSGEDITERKEIEEGKDDFIKIAGHELRTPITGMKIFAQIMQKRLKQTGDSQNIQINASMLSQINRLNQLVTELLDVNRAKEGRLEVKKKKFNMGSLINEIVAEYRQIVKTHVIKVNIKTNRQAKGDLERIRQVITNLINNAIKYSPEGSNIVVTTEPEKEGMRVSVEDFGSGIPEKEKEKIFRRFYRPKSQERKEKYGFGLGLYISTEIIKKHGGEIWVESKKNKGAKFIFTLPN